MSNERKRRYPGSNGQYYVWIHSKEEWPKIFNWLLKQNYSNIHDYSEDLYPEHPSVICIDEKDKNFGGTNITCMACAVTQGHRVIDFNEFLLLKYIIREVLSVDFHQDAITIYCQDLDMRCSDDLNKICYKICFDKENSDKLIIALTGKSEATEFSFLSSICNQFYYPSHVEHWYKLNEFEEFCKGKNINYDISLQSNPSTQNNQLITSSGKVILNKHYRH